MTATAAAALVGLTACGGELGTKGPVTASTAASPVRVLSVEEAQEVLRSSGISVRRSEEEIPRGILLVNSDPPADGSDGDAPPDEGDVSCSVEKTLIPSAMNAVLVFGPPVDDEHKVEVLAANVACTLYPSGEVEREQTERLVDAMKALLGEASS